ncbi:hypothetical protein ACIRRI_46025 [Streptomyces mirabilis]|uniref:hypothetical protein n=1 Tax=Streptomyces mirabilis TaxID=68239 RepID=UPI00381C1E2B
MPNDEDIVRSALELVSAPPGSDEIEALDPPSQAIAQAARPWVAGPGVIGLGVATKTKNGLATGGLALKVYVAQKMSLDMVPGNRKIPERVQLPAFGDVPTDVESIGKQSLEMLTARVRPVPSGYSLGPTTETGTLGCLVRKTGDSSKIYALSNSHVLALSGLSAVGVSVLQPGPSDGGRAEDSIATLQEWVPFNFDPGYKNFCDAAIAQVQEPAFVTSEVALIGKLNGVNKDLQRGMQIQKSGRSTGHTIATVKDVDYRTFMTYVKPDGTTGSAGFRNQVLCEKYSGPGDSGSLICDMGGMAVGLHWCGSESTSVFSPLSFVCDALNIELVI